MLSDWEKKMVRTNQAAGRPLNPRDLDDLTTFISLHLGDGRLCPTCGQVAERGAPTWPARHLAEAISHFIEAGQDSVLTVKDVALKWGVDSSTVHSYIYYGRRSGVWNAIPEPDASRRPPRWYRNTIEAHRRPGRGHRPAQRSRIKST